MNLKNIASVLFLTFALNASAQFTFSVAPGLSFNGASFGYKLGKFVPFIGVQHYGFSSTSSVNYKEYDFEQGGIVSKEESLFTRINLFLPNVGVKYFFIEREELKAHLSLNLTTPIIRGKIINNDGSGINDVVFDDFVEEINAFGGELSFGMEYFFTAHFSLGGEFGLRYAQINREFKFDDTVFDPNTGMVQEYEAVLESRLAISPTFTRISLNYYF